MKIYTRSGDDGGTALFGGGRVSKAELRVEAYGTVDELNSLLGVARGFVGDGRTEERIGLLQHDLFGLGSHLATPEPAEGRRRPELPPLPERRIDEMEAWIDEISGRIPELRAFVLPAGAGGAPHLHQARAVCRRAERRVVELNTREAVDPTIIRYLNRLSDLLFMFARLENHRSGLGDVEWHAE